MFLQLMAAIWTSLKSRRFLSLPVSLMMCWQMKFKPKGMTVIDVHAHLAWHKIYPAAFITALADPAAGSKSLPPGITNEHLLKFSKGFLQDSDCSTLIAQMDMAGIHK